MITVGGIYRMPYHHSEGYEEEEDEEEGEEGVSHVR